MAAGDPHCQGAVRRIIAAVMTDPDDRARRLAEKLRENLRKRKAQARDQPDAPAKDKDDTAR